ncbi:flagellar basal-body rod protein FlgB [Eubacterium oxidoreducens]|uniref:Flagellar basal body rod protein FlgB n=2 Tax=Eubacterium oxidoreducens TaxID=1732 RepID=A0A1G6AQE0_EUBOX|nr:flagellar basal body rod protein FlgB [Eubacterium oxidoreducens]SDB10591.1 flagellar basal-body rod protein FlgB [Eubacterium oxidoreducens]
MISTNAFSYADVLTKAADASYLRETLISNNIANVDTVGYKRQDVGFESVLERELGMSKYEMLDQKIENIHMNHLTATAYTDAENFSYREDGNNVDIDTENVELAAEQIRYQGLTESIDQEFSRLKSAIGN